MTLAKVTPADLRAMKARGEKIPSLTAYDYPMARLLDECGVPLLLVGDSLGMVVLGYPDTTHVTMADMEHHVRAAARARPRALLAADLPYRAYETSADAVGNARRLVAAGAEAVKAEGGRSVLEQARAVVAAGIPFIGHLGMLPRACSKRVVTTSKANATQNVMPCWPTHKRSQTPAPSLSSLNW
jgi:3-methyl-2-oxobutanoate hydroxymethyltransferase